MIAGLGPHPCYYPTPGCDALACRWRSFAVSACRDRSCPLRHERDRAADAAATAAGAKTSGMKRKVKV